MIVRRFLVASSLARLIRKERGSGRATEGYFATQSGRNSHVALEGGQSHLVLITETDGARALERTEVPRTHAEALLDVCSGRVVYDRSRFGLGGREALVDRFAEPGPLDLVSVEFDAQDEAEAFQPPVWFGPEVTTDPRHDNRAIALEGPPPPVDTVVSNAALDAVLDGLENRFAPRPALQPRRSDDVIDALRRYAAPPPSEPAPEEPSLPVVSEAEFGGAEATPPEGAPEEPVPVAASAQHPDARIDDVFQGLSQALSGLSTNAEPAPEPRSSGVIPVQRWAGRARRADS